MLLYIHEPNAILGSKFYDRLEDIEDKREIAGGHMKKQARIINEKDERILRELCYYQGYNVGRYKPYAPFHEHD